MASLHSLIAVVFFLLCGLTTALSQANSKSQGRNKNSTFMRRDIDAKANRMDEAIRSTTYIDDGKIREVLSKNYNSTINIIVMRISVIFGNTTRVCKRMKLYWANEVGRTILTVIRRAKDTIFTSPFFTMVLDVGTETVDIRTKAKRKAKRCPTSEQIFDSLLRELSHSDDTHSFKLCKAHRIKTAHHTTYNCCSIVGPKSFSLCADYSSPIVKFAAPMVAVMFCICCLMVVPLLLQYIATYPETKFYKMSDSPMSLGSIASGVLFEGRGPFKSLFRRGAFVAISYFVVFYKDFYGMEWLKRVFLTWAVLFMFFNDTRMTAKGNEEGKKCKQPREKCDCERKCNDRFAKCEECFSDQLQLDVKMLSCFTIPLCVLDGIPSWIAGGIKYWDDCIRLKVEETSCFGRVLYEFLHNSYSVLAGIVLGFFTVLSLAVYIASVAWRLLMFFLIDLLASFSWPCQRGIYILKPFLLFPRLLTLVMSAFLTCMIFISVLFLVVSLALNAEFFSPYIAPILAVILYFIKNWRWSVEAKCVQLKMLTIEISEEGLDDEMQNSDKSSKNKSTCKDRFLKVICPCFPCCCLPCNGNVDQDNSSLVNAGQNSSTANADQGNWCSLKCSCLCPGRNTDHGNSRSVNPEQMGFVENANQGNSSSVNSEEMSLVGNADQGNSSSVNPEQCCSGKCSCLPCDQNKDQDNDEKSIIKIDQCGEAMISKELYETITQSVLPLDRLLFNFFRRVIFVGLYSVCMLIIMTVAQKSGVSGSVQIISGILGILIPFVFDSIFAEHHLSQRITQEKAIKQKLQHILKTTRIDKNTVLVELVNINDNCNLAKSLDALCQKMAPRIVSFVALCKRIELLQLLSLEEHSPESSEESSPKPSVDLFKKVTLNVVSLDKVYQQITPTIESCLALIQEITPLVDSLANMFQQNSSKSELHEQITPTVASLIGTSEWIISSADSLVAKNKETISTAEKLIPSQDVESLKRFLNNAADSKDSYFESCEQFATSISSLVAEIQKVTPVAKSLKRSAESLNESAKSLPPPKREEADQQQEPPVNGN